MSAWVKVVDFHPQARRGRPPVLIGFVGPYRLLLVERHEPSLGEPKASLFVAKREPNNDRKPKTAGGRAEAERRIRELAAQFRPDDPDEALAPLGQGAEWTPRRAKLVDCRATPKETIP
jgi:hypothetical protein